MGAIAAVALRRYLRERSNLFFVLVLPFMIILLVGLGVGSTEQDRLAVAGAGTETGRAVLAHLPADRVDIHATGDSAVRAVQRTAAGGAVVFSDEVQDPVVFVGRTGVGLSARVELERAVAAENRRIALLRQAAVAGVGADEVERADRSVTPVGVVAETTGRALFDGLSGFEASSVTQVVLFIFLTSLTASTAMIADRDLGTARRKAAAPVPTWALVGGELLGRLSIAVFQAALIVTVTAVAFGVGWGNPVATAAVLMTFAVVATGTGVLLGALMRNAEAAAGVGVMLGLGLAALGGAMAPVEVLPPLMADIARLTPHYWAVEGLKDSVAGAGVSAAVRPTAVLGAFAVVVISLATVSFRRTVLRAR